MPNFSIPLSGLTAESTALSTIANNLSNQNTPGYKNKVVLFSDLFYQNLGTSGSGDPIQQGAGTQVSATPSLFTQGSVSATGVPTDVAIQGSGFFAVQNSSGVISYTRAGDFSELNNFLVTSGGQQVLGYPAVNGVVNTGAGIAPLQLGAGTISPPTATSNVELTTNLNAAASVGDTYASAQVDQRKIGRLAFAIQSAFQELGVFPPLVPMNYNEAIPPSTVRAIAEAAHKADAAHVASPRESLSAEDEANIAALQGELQQALQHEIDQHSVTLHRETQGLVISLREFGFFDSGSAALRPSAFPAVDRIASILAVRTCSLRIEGHTDNVPIHNAQIASNWELSTARSTEMVRLLIVRYRFAPQRLSAAGYAEYHPIASNATVQGRAQNRRVDVVILNDHIVRRAEAVPESNPSSAAP